VGNGDSERATARPPRLGPVGAGALSLALSSTVLLVPLAGFFIAPLGLVPVVQQMVAGRRGASVWGWVVAALLALTFAGVGPRDLPAWGFLASYLLVVVLPAGGIELWRATGWTEGRWIALTTLVGVVALTASVVAASWPETPVEALAGWWEGITAKTIEWYREGGVATGELELASDSIKSVVPWAAVGFWVGYLVYALFWIRPRLAVLGFEMPIAPFERYRGEEWLPAGFAAAGIGVLLLDGTPRWLAANLLIAVIVLYFVQGLAIIRAHLARWLGRGWLVRWGVGLLCLYPAPALIVAALGIVDGFYSLRPRTGDDGGQQ
jgi:hypothetical protein